MNYYLPKSALKSDVRDITLKATRHRIIAILVKSRSDKLYNELTYIAKDMSIEDEVFNPIYCQINLPDPAE